MVSAWRNFKNIFPRPFFIIIFRPEMLKFHPYSILTRGHNGRICHIHCVKFARILANLLQDLKCDSIKSLVSLCDTKDYRALRALTSSSPFLHFLHKLEGSHQNRPPSYYLSGLLCPSFISSRCSYNKTHR